MFRPHIRETCPDCRYAELSIKQEPCESCDPFIATLSRWEPRPPWYIRVADWLRRMFSR